MTTPDITSNVLRPNFGERTSPETVPTPDVVEPFHAAVQDRGRLQRVAGYLVDNYRISQDAIRTAEDHLEFAGGEVGARLACTIDVQKGTGDVIVLATHQFPELLAKLTDLKTTEAIELAANTVVAHGLLLAQRVRPSWRINSSRALPENDGLNPKRWGALYREPHTARSVNYRFAGAVGLGMRTLRGLALFPPDTPADLAMPPDLAGLANPATPRLMRAVVERHLV